MTAPPRRRRLLVAIVIGACVALVAWGNYRLQPPGGMSDFDQCWIAARALLDHRDPYAAVRAAHAQFALAYPLPAVLLVMPLTTLPIAAARVAFVGLGAGVGAYGVTTRSWHPLWMFASGAFFESLLLAQWSPLLVGAAFIPVLGAVLLAKPNLGAVLAAGWPSRWMLLGAGALLVLSIAVWPSWPTEWLGAIRTLPHFGAPVTLLGGPLLLLAALRWRRPEGRLLLALACVPQTLSLYSALPLFLVPATRRQALSLVLLADAAYGLFVWRGPYPSIIAQSTAAGYITLWCLYVPCLFMVLRRPNEGEVPAWVERGIMRLRRRPELEPEG